MKQICGIWLPDDEQHLISLIERGRGTYQYRTLQRTLWSCDRFGVAIDVGGHVGLWSMHLARHFRNVIAFEPVLAHRECFARNVSGKQVTLMPYALGDRAQHIRLSWGGENTGHTHVGEGTIEVEMRKLDDFQFQHVDLLKIDTEGYEVFVLRGAEQTLVECRPILCIEQKPHDYYGQSTTAGVEYLQSLGAIIFDRVKSDYIMGWPEKRRVWRRRLRSLIGFGRPK